MVVVNITMKHDVVKAVAEAIAEPKFELKEETKLNMVFECSGDDAAGAATLKKALKAEKSLAGMYFAVNAK